MKFLSLLALLLLSAFTGVAQIITGSLVGSVADPTGLAVAGAKLTLSHTATGRERLGETDARGEFVFNGLESGAYKLTISQSGFKQMERSNLILATGERLSTGVIALDIGAVSEVVSVSAERGSVVMTQSAERADLISSRQVDGLLNIGRNVTSLVQLMPGVVVTQESAALGRRTDFNVLGSRRTQNNISIDGLPAVDVGNGFAHKLVVSQDAVAEVKILLSNYQAEHGRMAGSNMHIVTKSGTRDFHGLISHFKRHEQFNANNFFNNQVGQAKPRYRYNTWAYNVGGPVLLPGGFNRQRNKMFFFWAQEFWPTKTGIVGTVTTPTGLERVGDFSQSLDLNDRLIVVRDPTANAPFPGNRIPTNRVDSNGAALLKVFPDPNFFDRAISRGSYNYVFNTETSSPTRTDTAKIDYNFNERNFLVASYNGFYEKHDGQLGFPTAVGNWPQWRYGFAGDTQGLTARYTRIISPAVVNEFHFGWMHHPERNFYEQDTVTRNQRDTVGYRTPQFFPEINPLSLIPNATFGGVPSAATLNKDGRWPFTAINNILNWDNKLSMTRGAHSLKAGLYVEFFQRDIGQPVLFAGAIDFGRNVNNPLDTNYAYSNAALGVFNSYSEASGRPYPRSFNTILEWFVQDNWRATSRLTLDYGMRFYLFPPIYERDNRIAGFVPGRFDPSRQVRLITPGLDPQGRRIGVHPTTGAAFPASLIGAIAPGVGDPANGMLVAGQDPNYPRALTNGRGVHFGPRIGFAYDVFGNSKTAIRGGLGLFYNRPNFGDWLLPYAAQPPLVQTPVINFGSLSTLASSTGLLFPTSVLALDPVGRMPTVTNFSLSIQQSVGKGTVLDIGYVGALGRHLMWQRPLNAIPFGSNFLPANRDTTTAANPFPAPFLRPTVGYNDINIRETASSSNYHSLQVTLNRKLSRGLQFGAAWTWSKAMDYNDDDGTGISALVPVRVWNYGLAGFDRTHVVKLNWLWDVPSTPWNNVAAKMVLNGWQLSGITSVVSGRPLGVDLTTVTPIDITGSPTDGARVVVTGNPVLPKSERTFARNFRTDVFQLPARGTFGNAAKTLLRGPGVNDWDIAVFKNFPVREAVRLQFRWELYNAFNHTQFSALDTTARFDAAGQQVNQRLGQFTAASDPRVMQFALRLYF